MQDQQAELEWRDGAVPVSVQFDDPYFSLDNGLAETRHVFLDGNGLPARFRDGLLIAELGFGTGLNFLTTWAAWRAAGVPGKFHFVSFEAFPMAPADMEAALAAFPELSPLADALIGGLGPDGRATFDDATVQVVFGDVRQTLPAWNGRADAWYLDGFSPAKNPEMWGADLMAEVARHTAAHGTAATYTAAGFVRRGLQDAGFSVTRAPGFGRKRHMTRAVMP
jgi:tRNA U34 5-methylaminomethyl-2-thiouridine-forming methyltransferase MnmC